MTKPKDIWDNQFANLLLDSMAEGVFTLTAAGVIRSWNPSMEKISGYPAAEAIGRTCRLLKFSSCFDRSCPKDVKACGIFKKAPWTPWNADWCIKRQFRIGHQKCPPGQR
ncbi:MAG: PAS domain-containing protein [Desulfobacterales bacterium]